jgi:hypothetical protein
MPPMGGRDVVPGPAVAHAAAVQTMAYEHDAPRGCNEVVQIERATIDSGGNKRAGLVIIRSEVGGKTRRRHLLTTARGPGRGEGPIGDPPHRLRLGRHPPK